MFAWHGEPTLKEAALERLREHRKLDQIVQKQYWVGGRGCHLGCLTHADKESSPHAQTERLFGIEQRIGYWLEAVFEGLPQRECAAWVIDSCEAIPVGADLSRCHHEFAAWLLTESGLLTVTDVNREAIEDCAALHRRAAAGERVDDDSWSEVETALETAERSALESASWSAVETAVWSAWSAADSASWSAARAAESAARAAVWSARAAARAARSAARAAWSAADSAAWSAESAESAARAAARAAESAAWRSIANRSLEIFRNAPIPEHQPGISREVQRELCCRNLWCPDGEVVLAM